MASPGNLLEMNHLRSAESEILGVRPTTYALSSPTGDTEAHTSLRTTGLKEPHQERI